jgi:hypothetical protein
MAAKKQQREIKHAKMRKWDNAAMARTQREIQKLLDKKKAREEEAKLKKREALMQKIKEE